MMWLRTRILTSRRIAVVVLVLVGLFWTAVMIAGSRNPDYSQSRDYVSALASIGAENAWLGMFAIAAIGVALVLTSRLVKPFSRTAAIAVALAGLGFVVGAFARIRCVEGAAYCGVGDRMSIDLENTRGYVHESAVVLATVLLVIAMTALGVAVLRGGRRGVGIASLVAAFATVLTFALVSGDSPGTMQRIWIAVMTLWAIGVAVWTLTRAANVHSA
jgi:hypothetical membrane protein